MKKSINISGVLRPQSNAIRSIGSGFLFTLAFAIIVAVLLSQNLGDNDLIGGDEGYYGVMARNIQEDPSYIINPSLSPLGKPGDKPFLYPLILSAALDIGGINEFPLRFVSLIFSILTGLIIYFTVGLITNFRTGVYASLIYLSTPLLANTGRLVAAEPILVTFSMAGVLLFMFGCRRDRLLPALISGMFFGAAFLCKLWLALIPAFGVCVGMTIFRLIGDTNNSWKYRTLPMLISLACGFLAVGSIQIVLCIIFSPEHLQHWLGIYFGFSLTSRATGEGFASYWYKPWHFYLITLGRSLSLWLPLISAGLFSLSKNWRRSPAFLVTVCWLLPLIPMSLIPVKSGGYILPIIPPLILAAGAGLISMMPTDHSPRKRALLFSAIVALLLYLLTQVSISANGHLSLNNPVILLIQITWIAGLIMATLPFSVLKSRVPIIINSILLFAIIAGLYRDRQITKYVNHATGYAKLAETVAPLLEGIDPTTPCFFSPEWPSISFYTFRTGSYWESPYNELDERLIFDSINSDRPYLYIFGNPGNALYGDLASKSLRLYIRERTVPVYFTPPIQSQSIEAMTNHSMF